jgi:hypothetical protein
MPQTLERMLALALTSLLVLWNSRAEAEPETPHVVPVFSPTLSSFRPPLFPPYLRFFGTLLTTEPQEKSGLRPVLVSIGRIKWVFHLEEVEALTGSSPGSMILAQVFPRQLHFVGPPKLMQQLQDPAIAGRFIVVEGRLYISSRRLLVTGVVGGEEIRQQ